MVATIKNYESINLTINVIHIFPLYIKQPVYSKIFKNHNLNNYSLHITIELFHGVFHTVLFVFSVKWKIILDSPSFFLINYFIFIAKYAIL